MATLFQHEEKTMSTQTLYEESIDQEEMGCEDSDGNILEDERNPTAAEKPCNPSEPRAETESSFVTVLKDFFRSTFSDHYPTEAYCCGGSEFITAMPGSTYCYKTQRNCRIAPEGYEMTTQPEYSNNPRDLQHSVSQSSTDNAIHKAPPRQKALAVATGYKYAEDMDGRPVVIVPGTRKLPIDLTNFSAHSQYLRQYRHERISARQETRATTTSSISRLPGKDASAQATVERNAVSLD